MPLPGYAASGYVQANLPRAEWYSPISQIQLLRLQNEIDNLQSGAAPINGINFRIQAGILALKNVDTSLYNRPDTAGANGAQQITLGDGQA